MWKFGVKTCETGETELRYRKRESNWTMKQTSWVSGGEELETGDKSELEWRSIGWGKTGNGAGVEERVDEWSQEGN